MSTRDRPGERTPACMTGALLLSALLLMTACAVNPPGDARAGRGELGGSEQAWLPRHPDTAFRMLVWNVSRANFFREQAAAGALLRAAAADVLVLDEMPGNTSESAIAAALPPPTGRWRVVYGVGGGGFQRASIASLTPLQRVDGFDRLAYPDGLTASWLAQAPQRLLPGLRADLPAGVPAVGATVEIGGRSLLVVGLDLQCCGEGIYSWEEEKRRFEAAAIRRALDGRIERSAPDGVIVAGDFNIVQGEGPLQILIGTDVRQMPLETVVPARRLSAATWTWDGRGTRFESKQLDFVLHSSALIPLQARILDSEDMEASELAALGLEAGTSAQASSHRPIVVDFGWR